MLTPKYFAMIEFGSPRHTGYIQIEHPGDPPNSVCITQSIPGPALCSGWTFRFIFILGQIIGMDAKVGVIEIFHGGSGTYEAPWYFYLTCISLEAYEVILFPTHSMREINTVFNTSQTEKN